MEDNNDNFEMREFQLSDEEWKNINEDYLHELEQIDKDKKDAVLAVKNQLDFPYLYEYLEDTLDGWFPEGIVDVKLTEEKKNGYESFQHVRVVDDEHDNHLYCESEDEWEVNGEDHKIEYFVWQTVGYSGDDYSGMMLFPMKNDKFFRVSYSC